MESCTGPQRGEGWQSTCSMLFPGGRLHWDWILHLDVSCVCTVFLLCL